uniref:Strictosidine synthase conserved region domain-containing protein n=1 Tax=Oryza barthii TaxID=65489 RepID=A0A0D3GTG4_9ORYZ
MAQQLGLFAAAARFPPNNLLQNLEKLGEGMLSAPEDVYVDDAGGEVFTATRDGWVRRMQANGSWAARGSSASPRPPTAPCSSATPTRIKLTGAP